MAEIRPGTPVHVRNMFNDWLEAIAVGGIQPTHVDGRKVHDFPVVWVRFTTKGEPVPWPAEDVRVSQGYGVVP